MISYVLQKWTLLCIICLSVVYPQMMPLRYGYGGPMMMPAPMPPPMPMAMPVPFPVAVPIPYPESTSTTTTTTTEASNDGGGDNGMAIAIPMPVPHFVQIAVPGFVSQVCTSNNKKEKRNKNCPPCPPCSCNPCTPSFFSFCSPCHLECRCKNGKPNPIPKEPNPPTALPGPAYPMPMPFPGPPPVVIVPFPPQFNHPKRPAESECESRPASNSFSEESKSQDSCESNQSRKKKRKKRKKRPKYDINRRNFDLMKRNRDDNGLVEPVLTYMSRNGDIKMKRRLTNDEADALLGPGESYNNVQLIAGEDENRRSRVLVRSKPGMRSLRRRQQFFTSQSQHFLGDGKKELVFKTPENKKISNLSVSFQINK